MSRAGWAVVWLCLAASMWTAQACGQSAHVQQEEEQVIPRDLAEAHQELERSLSAELLREVDQMKAEGEMARLHFQPGVSLRNKWGLRKGSALAQSLRAQGFVHPDDMSAVILATFWCKRHGQPFRLKERAQAYALYWRSQEPPGPEVKDPRDASVIQWASFKLDAETDKGEGYTVHVGRSATTGAWVAYDCLKGAYAPQGRLLERIKEASASP